MCFFGIIHLSVDGRKKCKVIKYLTVLKLTL